MSEEATAAASASASTSSEAAAASTSTEKLIILVSKELEEFVIEVRLALQSQTLKENINEEQTDDSVLPIPGAKSKTLAKVIEYWKHHIDDDKDNRDAKAKEERRKFDTQWANVDESLVELVLGANYLNPPSMLHLTCQTIGNHIKNISVEDCREYFQIVNDFTPEKAEIPNQDKWALDEDK